MKNFLQTKENSGFTLIELLVAITIMVVVGTVTLSNYNSFGEDRKLKNAVLDIQSLINTAQTNAATNVRCGTKFGSTWQVEFTNSTTVLLKCQNAQSAPITRKTINIDPNIAISLDNPSVPCPTSLGFAVNFTAPSGKADLGGPTGSKCSLIRIKLTHIKTQSTTLLFIEQGGRIYVQ